MSLTLQDVQRIANLARLELNQEQQAASLNDLNNIFGLVEAMRAVDTTGVAPLAHPVAAILPQLALRLRADEVTESDQRAAFQAVAPATEDGLYLVPRVVE
ncbi:Asp-tRNA(Asn)/Glu-tRNA(Gln) amidotransferase subunit GatC [Massilia sp. W12]|uniref:Asp-tRNA(Asn)/Glu-tRNA(Gln) amidotransferase subunit GatC n=1 Tax=Massilia sp. W12 TaxID=3126507 RepID=UPI0030D59759